MPAPQKTPSRTWKIWNQAVALTTTLKNPKTKRDAQDAARKTGYTVGLTAAAFAINALPIMFVSFAAGAVGLVALVTGFRAYRGIQDLRKSSVVREYMRKKTDEWQRNLKTPPKSSLLAGLKKACLVLGRGVSAGLVAVGLGVGGLAGLEIAGVALPAAAAAAVAGMTSVAALPIVLGAAVITTIMSMGTFYLCMRGLSNMAAPKEKAAAAAPAAKGKAKPAAKKAAAPVDEDKPKKSRSIDDIMASFKAAAAPDDAQDNDPAVKTGKKAAPKL